MTQYPVSPEDQPMQARDMFVPEHAPATPSIPPTEEETAPSAAQSAEPKPEAASSHPHVPASRLMGQIVSDSEAH